MKAVDWCGCPIRFATGLLGDKWSLLIIRDLMFKQKQSFSEFSQSDEGIATNILSDRLRHLEKSGLIVKSTDPNNRRRRVYKLTNQGIDLAPTLLHLIDWAETYDAQTEVPRDFIEEYRKNRSRFTKRLMAQLKKEEGPKIGG